MPSDHTPKHYQRAPIAEAVIDIQVERGSSELDLGALAESLSGEFPEKLPLYELEVGFKIEPGPDANPEFLNQQRRLGWRLQRKDGARVLQLRPNGFTYSHLAPYSTWAVFSSEAEGLWNTYVSATKPLKANRLAVRVLNKMPIKSDEAGLLGDFLNLYPLIPDSLPPDALSIMMQVRLPMKHVDPDAVVALGLYNAPVPQESDTIGLVLDIDFFIMRPTNVGQEVFRIINQLGVAKDEVFEASITDRIRERIK